MKRVMTEVDGKILVGGGATLAEARADLARKVSRATGLRFVGMEGDRAGFEPAASTFSETPHGGSFHRVTCCAGCMKGDDDCRCRGGSCSTTTKFGEKPMRRKFDDGQPDSEDRENMLNQLGDLGADVSLLGECSPEALAEILRLCGATDDDEDDDVRLKSAPNGGETVRPFGEKGARFQTFAEKQADVAKVEKFAEAHSGRLALCQMSPQEFVDIFKKEQARTGMDARTYLSGRK
jgi:hypothetical protein